ncbi:MAG: hypothetical protein KZQ71_09135, partial [Candidatus Thiodiazotropha sp. (ex Lucinoma aequizonata)]|nr:hypothetical protein [Candidatus Thiodiazotropha sp. (ex Lucinoma aequizonata)]MCU7908792.1 hypothetical protein [Candidatus Thiodiazotropha sp. (ex Lucinoma aequizonata)]
SGHNRLSKIESILVDWDVPKSFTRSKTRLRLVDQSTEQDRTGPYRRELQLLKKTILLGAVFE